MTQDAGDQSGSPTVSRRNFIEGLGFASGGVAIGLLVGAGIPALTGDGNGVPRVAAPQATEEPTVIVEPTVLPAVATAHPRVRVASLGELEVGQPLDFAYPTEQTPVSLVKLGRTADAPHRGVRCPVPSLMLS